MKRTLQVLEVLPGEIAHHYEPICGNMILSKANSFWGEVSGQKFTFTLNLSLQDKLKAATRLGRRLTRTDKSAATFNYARDGVIVHYLGEIYFFDIARDSVKNVGRLRQCRNTLHCGFAVNAHGIFFGEYGANSERNSVPLWVSRSDGRTWEVAYEFSAGSIKHIHGVFNDPYSRSLWVPTGDFAGECGIFELPEADPNRIIRHGDGHQEWRPVSMLFEKDHIIWGMDSQLQTSHLQTMDRTTGKLTQGRAFPGPIWYSKRLLGGLSLLQSSVESGPGSKSNCAHIFASEDLKRWEEIARYKKDMLPMIFKFGVVAFAEGEQFEDDFVIFGEALSGFDGRIFRVAIQ